MTLYDEFKAAQASAGAAWLDQAVQDAVTAATAPLQRQVDQLQLENANLASVNTSLQAQLTTTQQALEACQAQTPAPVPTPEPTPAQMLVGATLRGTSTSAKTTRPRPVWDIVRTFNNTDMLSALNENAGRRVATSYGSMLGGPGWRNNAATVNALQGQLAKIPDIPGQWVADTHEFDNPSKYGADYTTYLADAAKFKQVVDGVNQTRQYPLSIFRCSMAYSISQPARQIDAFYMQDPENYDAYGPDVYKPADIDRVVAKAQLYNKPLVMPEYGRGTVDGTDAAILAYMQQANAAWSDVATFVCWFDKGGSGGDLDQYPNALNYWTGLVVG